jgi:hydrophobe/amphiphile efflux-1 (HAE1) family protein
VSLSEFSVRHPVFAWMLMSSLIIFGGISFTRMGISENPDVDFPIVVVSASLKGASPEVMELSVTDVIEDAMMTVEGVTGVSSNSRQGTASVTVEFDINKDINFALQEIQNRLIQVQGSFPRDMDPPTARKINPEDQPIMWLSVRSPELTNRELSDFVKTNLEDRIARVPGVADLMIGGSADPIIRIDVDPAKLNSYALTVKDVTNAISSEHVERPGGQFSELNRELGVRTYGEAKTLEDISRIRMNTRGGSPNFIPIEIQQIASVSRGVAEVRRISRTNGEASIGIGVRKQRGSNAVAVADGVKREIAALEGTLPNQIKLAVNFDSTAFIKENVAELNLTLILAAVLTALVCLFFLGSLSSTLNIILAIPTSIIGTFIFLYFSGFTLNTFTLLGLSIAIGIVVDDAIMMLENIQRHREMGKTKFQAAIDGSREISYAALVATIAIIAIFLPVVFMEGIIGKYLLEFGITVSVAVSLSLVEALTLTPMRCSQLLSTSSELGRFGRGVDHVFANLRGLYGAFVGFALNHRWKIVLSSLVFFAGSFASLKYLKFEFAPVQDQSRFLMRVQTAVDSNIQFTDQKFKEVEAFLASRPEVERFFASVGGFGGNEVNSGVIFVTMKPKGKRGIDPKTKKELSQQDFMNVVRQELKSIKDANIFIQDLSQRGFSGSGRGFPVEFTIRGPDWESLGKYAKEIVSKMNEAGFVSDADSSYREGAPELQITPDRIAAAARGVSIENIGDTVAALTNGVEAGKFSEKGRRYDIRVQLASDTNKTREVLERLFVRNNRGELVPLKAVVKIEEKSVLSSVQRKDRERSIQIFGNVAKGKSQTEAIAHSQKIANELLPEDYKVVLSGTAQSFKDSFRSLLFALILGIVIAYMVLASQYNSYVHPLTVLMALPFSVSGAFLGLLAVGQSFNLYSFIGLLLLMGIVKKNSILLVDYTNQLRSQGLGLKEALLKACPTRLRPILMTSFATIAGAMPAALSIGPGAETRQPMAIAIVGGVLVSTLLTLFVVPCVYSLLYPIERRVDPAPAQERAAA